MSSRQVARRYAQAFCDVVAARNEQQQALEEIRAFRDLLDGSTELREIISSPAVGRIQKERLLQSILEKTRPSRATENLLRVLLRNERLGGLPEIAEEFARELDRRQGVAMIEVKSARPLTTEQKQGLERRFEEMTGRKVRVHYQEDEGLIGGVVAQWGSEVYDGSVRTQLEKLREQLAQ